MKIKFKLTQATHLAPAVIISSTVLWLKDNDYKVTNSTHSIIEFDERPWKLRWGSDAIKRLHGGRFEIGVQDNVVLVTLTHYLNLTHLTGMFIVFSFVLIRNEQYWQILFILLLCLVIIPIHIVEQKRTASDLLNTLLNDLP